MNIRKFTQSKTAWCPGCGNFSILAALTEVLNELGKNPKEVVLVGGIGQAAKTNQYSSANGFSGLHGRALPAAVATKIVNESLTVIVNTGDGDSYGEGGNHFLHNIRRNVDIVHLVHNNKTYGLTKGQCSPTTDSCEADNNSSNCNLHEPFNPLLIAIATGATFVARAYSGRKTHLKQMIKAAIAHKGYALVDILQPCVTFNKINSFAYYNQRVFELNEQYDPADINAAMQKTREGGNHIPIGIFYRRESHTYHDKRSKLFNGMPLIDRKHEMKNIEALLESLR